MTSVRVLGIDPGSAVTGWGIVEQREGALKHVADGCIRTQANAPLPQRLATIYNALDHIIQEFRPTMVAVEEVFVSHNVQSALKLGHARGAAIVAAAQHGLMVHEYTAVAVKKSVVGYGRAEKGQVQEMMRMLLALKAVPAQDAADALAVAVCHLHQSQWHAKVGG